jgi:hypothetical protein
VLLLWCIFTALDALRELCDHPKSHRLQQTLRSPANSAGEVGLCTGEATITKRAELEQLEEHLAIGANVVLEIKAEVSRRTVFGGYLRAVSGI